LIICFGQNTRQFPVPAPVQQWNGVPRPVHAAWVQFPVPAPVQQLAGMPAAVQSVLVGTTPVRLAVPVVSGFRLIGMFPMNCAHWAPAHVPPVEQMVLLFAPP
jgi:hypothetical protein